MNHGNFRLRLGPEQFERKCKRMKIEGKRGRKEKNKGKKKWFKVKKNKKIPHMFFEIYFSSLLSYIRNEEFENAYNSN